MDYEDWITPWTPEQKRKKREETDKVYAEFQYAAMSQFSEKPSKEQLKFEFEKFKQKEDWKMELHWRKVLQPENLVAVVTFREEAGGLQVASKRVAAKVIGKKEVFDDGTIVNDDDNECQTDVIETCFEFLGKKLLDPDRNKYLKTMKQQEWKMCQDYEGKCTWKVGYVTCNEDCKKCFNKACPFCARKVDTNVRPKNEIQKA